MIEQRLFTPGPTPVPKEVLEALAQPMIHHRSEEYVALSSTVRKKLNALAGTSGDSVIFASSGTGGMEAAVGSFLCPGDEVLCIVGGKFGERWVDLANHFQLKPNILSVEWGRAVKIDDIVRAITPKTQAILIQACESSTGAYHPVEKIRQAVKRDDLLIVVDAITALGIHDLEMDRDGIDVLICGSQKALMCPPGLSTVSLSQRAIERLKKNTPQTLYFSLQAEIQALQKGAPRFTPSISLIRALNAALTLIEKEGKKALFERQKRLQKTARSGLQEIGFKLFNRDEEATLGITAAFGPPEKEIKPWLAELKKKQGLWMAGGQGELEGKIFRLSHMGACGYEDLKWALQKIKESL